MQFKKANVELLETFCEKDKVKVSTLKLTCVREFYCYYISISAFTISFTFSLSTYQTRDFRGKNYILHAVCRLCIHVCMCASEG